LTHAFGRSELTCGLTQSSLLLAILVFLAGCTTIRVQPIPTEVPTQGWQSSQMLDALGERREQFQSMRALARVNYSGPTGKNGFQEAVLVARPNRLRLETLVPVLGAISIVTVNDKEISAYQPRDGVYLHGQRSKANLLRYTQIPLELEEMTALLLGVPPVDPKAPAEQNGNSLIFTSANGRKDTIAFESNQPAPTKWERSDARGQPELTAEFTDYIQTPSGIFPSTIVIESPQQKRRLEIRYEQPELNVSLSNDLFAQAKPPNVKEYPIEALGK
jgi:outer membrane lipoprotein-sorting protein